MIARLHYLTQDIPGITHAQLAEEACAAGVRWVQLRAKGKSHDEWRKIAEEVKEVCNKYNAVFIVNDNVEIAKKVQAHGVHIGKEDTPPAEARRFLGSRFIIGGSSNTAQDLLYLQQQGVDYAGIGPFRFTTTRSNLNPILGPVGIKKILEEVKPSIPVVAIGGIVPADLERLIKSGVHGVAVSSAIGLAEDKAGVVAMFLQKLTNEPSFHS